MEKRKEERYALPEMYSRHFTFKAREVSGDFLDAELFNFAPGGLA